MKIHFQTVSADGRPSSSGVKGLALKLHSAYDASAWDGLIVHGRKSFDHGPKLRKRSLQLRIGKAKIQRKYGAIRQARQR